MIWLNTHFSAAHSLWVIPGPRHGLGRCPSSIGSRSPAGQRKKLGIGATQFSLQPDGIDDALIVLRLATQLVTGFLAELEKPVSALALVKGNECA